MGGNHSTDHQVFLSDLEGEDKRSNKEIIEALLKRNNLESLEAAFHENDEAKHLFEELKLAFPKKANLETFCQELTEDQAAVVVKWWKAHHHHHTVHQ